MLMQNTQEVPTTALFGIIVIFCPFYNNYTTEDILIIFLVSINIIISKTFSVDTIDKTTCIYFNIFLFNILQVILDMP